MALTARRIGAIAVRLVLIGILLALGMAAWMYAIAMSDPVVRRLRVTLPTMAHGTPPVTAVLISDIHVSGPDMSPERLARIVRQINALKPDIVLMAGDYVSDKQTATRTYSFAEMTAPLAALRPRIGVYAILGNHDYRRSEHDAHAALTRAGVHVIDNDALRAGPITIGGLSDAFSQHDDLPKTIAAMHRLGGPGLIITHSPDPFVRLPADIPLMLAGHTHCGQISFPIVGAPTYASRYGARFACGIIREDGKVLVVTAGLGTSALPLRFGAVPDMWLIEIAPRG